MKRCFGWIAFLCVLVVAGSERDAAQEVAAKLALDVKEVPLAELPKSVDWSSLTVSLDMKRFAFVVQDKGKRQVVLDGESLEPYADIRADSLRFSPDSKRLAFVASKTGHFLSGASINARTGASAELLTAVGGDMAVVVDGKEMGGFQTVEINSLVFSPDSRQIAFLAKSEAGWRLYLDGTPASESFESLAPFRTPPQIRFSPDGKHTAFAAVQNGQASAVEDGKKGKAYDGIVDDSIVYSPDSRRFAFAAKRGQRQSVVIDGKEQPEYAAITPGSLVFSADSKRFGYLATPSGDQPGTRCLAVLNGSPQKELTLADAGAKHPSAIFPERLCFSPDGDRYAWVMWNYHRGERGEVAEIGAQVVVDGAAGDEVRSLLSDLHYGPDGGRLAFVAAYGTGAPHNPYGDVHMVVDGKPGRRYVWIEYPSVCFSPDGRYLAYIGVSSADVKVVDGRARIAGNVKLRLVVNEVEGPEYERFIAVAPYGQAATPLGRKTEVVFTGPRALSCVATRGRRVVRIEATILESR